MNRLMIVPAVCALLAGCDYTTPLAKTANLPIDAAVVGLWQRMGEDHQIESLLVLPLSPQEYLVVFPVESQDAMFARACFWRSEGATWVQLDWFGTARGKLPEDNRTFQYATYTVEPGMLTVRLLNPEVVSRDIASSDGLAQAIAAQKEHPNLFREKMEFQKVRN